MPLSKEIAPHLAYLRRYARALTGSQQSGDAYVVSALEALVADPDSFPRALGARVGLYRVFTQLWSSIALNEAPFPAPRKRKSRNRPRCAISPR